MISFLGLLNAYPPSSVPSHMVLTDVSYSGCDESLGVESGEVGLLPPGGEADRSRVLDATNSRKSYVVFRMQYYVLYYNLK